MVFPIESIVLRTVKYSDTSSIATVWSRQRGRMAVAVPSGGGKESRRLRAIMMPLGAFEGVARLSAGQDVARVSDVKILSQSPAASGNPAKGVIAMFLADFLYAVLKESTPDEHLSDFLFRSLRWLENASGTALANFHLMFAYRLGHFLGISPDSGTYRQGYYFDMKEGQFLATPPMHSISLNPKEAKMAWILSRINVRSLGCLKLSRTERNEILDRILQYYSLHYAQVSHTDSLSIIRDIFS